MVELAGEDCDNSKHHDNAGVRKAGHFPKRGGRPKLLYSLTLPNVEMTISKEARGLFP